MQHQTSKSRRNLHVTIYLLIQDLFRSRLIYDYSVLRVLHSAPFLAKFGLFLAMLYEVEICEFEQCPYEAYAIFVSPTLSILQPYTLGL
jgi:hypothetical protein